MPSESLSQTPRKGHARDQLGSGGIIVEELEWCYKEVMGQLKSAILATRERSPVGQLGYPLTAPTNAESMKLLF